MPSVIGGVVNTGHIDGKLDLKTKIRSKPVSQGKSVVGGLINTGFIGSVNLESDIDNDKEDETEGGNNGNKTGNSTGYEHQSSSNRTG